jgi:hypothetical protein
MSLNVTLKSIKTANVTPYWILIARKKSPAISKKTKHALLLMKLLKKLQNNATLSLTQSVM